MTDIEKRRLEDLRIWSSRFFRENSITYISWWNDAKKNKGKAVDLVVKKQKVVKNVVHLIDSNYNTYTLKLNSDEADIKNFDIFTYRCCDLK